VAFELERPWALSPQVSLRPERFGALAYHFGTRRLSFLKSPRLLRVVEALGDEPSALAACRRAGVPAAQMAEYERALATLAETDMIRARTGETGAGDDGVAAGDHIAAGEDIAAGDDQIGAPACG